MNLFLCDLIVVEDLAMVRRTRKVYEEEGE